MRLVDPSLFDDVVRRAVDHAIAYLQTRNSQPIAAGASADDLRI